MSGVRALAPPTRPLSWEPSHSSPVSGEGGRGCDAHSRQPTPGETLQQSTLRPHSCTSPALYKGAFRTHCVPISEPPVNCPTQGLWDFLVLLLPVLPATSGNVPVPGAEVLESMLGSCSAHLALSPPKNMSSTSSPAPVSEQASPSTLTVLDQALGRAERAPSSLFFWTWTSELLGSSLPPPSTLPLPHSPEHCYLSINT